MVVGSVPVIGVVESEPVIGVEIRMSAGATMPDSVAVCCGNVEVVAAADARIAFNPVAYFEFAFGCDSDPVASSPRAAVAKI